MHKSTGWVVVGLVGASVILIVAGCGEDRSPAPTPSASTAGATDRPARMAEEHGTGQPTNALEVNDEPYTGDAPTSESSSSVTITTGDGNAQQVLESLSVNTVNGLTVVRYRDRVVFKGRASGRVSSSSTTTNGRSLAAVFDANGLLWESAPGAGAELSGGGR